MSINIQQQHEQNCVTVSVEQRKTVVQQSGGEICCTTGKHPTTTKTVGQNLLYNKKPLYNNKNCPTKSVVQQKTVEQQQKLSNKICWTVFPGVQQQTLSNKSETVQQIPRHQQQKLSNKSEICPTNIKLSNKYKTVQQIKLLYNICSQKLSNK